MLLRTEVSRPRARPLARRPATSALRVLCVRALNPVNLRASSVLVLHYFHHFRVASIIVVRRPHLRAAGPFSFSATGEGHARPNHLSSVFSPLDPIRVFLLFLSLILHLKSPAAPRLLHIILWNAFARPLRA